MSRGSSWVRIYHLKCMMKRVVPVTFSRHKERAIGIGSVVDSINIVQFFSGRQVPNNVWIVDRHLYREDLHEASVSSSCLRQGITSLPGMSAVLLRNCMAMYPWAR
jgi:hypothetical protein